MIGTGAGLYRIFLTESIRAGDTIQSTILNLCDFFSSCQILLIITAGA